ncbi:hypothetical protein [Streptomyces gibsoniae]|uniref:Uncharacterized protein n=1 Tax=Streptomyces gibsoniae TaxID=3075529 RepID=A0ABU2TVT1_9ACTN|nr:hypothetical protein [Streptomyces sp. DSM 41699]MDT0464926.1 hypothetical protein [Streptomyces sp. DSM 41699]
MVTVRLRNVHDAVVPLQKCLQLRVERESEARFERLDLLDGGGGTQGGVVDGTVHGQPGREAVPRRFERGDVVSGHAMTLDPGTGNPPAAGWNGLRLYGVPGVSRFSNQWWA